MNPILLVAFILFSSITIAQAQLPSNVPTTGLQNLRQDTNKVNKLNAIARSLASTKPDSALIFAKRALAISRKIDWAIGIGQSYHNIGRFHYALSNYSASLHYNDSALHVWNFILSTDDKCQRILELKSKTLGNIGIVYDDQGDYPKAIKYYLEALKIAEQIGNQRSVATKLGNLGVTFCHNTEYEKALSYYSKALNIGENLHDTEIVASQLNNIGYVYYVQKDYTRAIDNCLKAEKMAKVGNFKETQANACGTIGHIYFDQKDYAQALPYLNKTLQLYEELNSKSGIAKSLSAIGALYSATNQNSKAEDYLFKALAIDTIVGFIFDIQNTSEELSKLYTKIGDDKKALFYYKMAILAKDSLYSINKNREIAGREFTYEKEKQHIADSIRNAVLLKIKDDTIRDQEYFQKTLKIVLFVVSTILIVISILLILFSRRRKLLVGTIQELKEEFAPTFRQLNTLGNALVSFSRRQEKEGVKIILSEFNKWKEEFIQESNLHIKLFEQGLLLEAGSARDRMRKGTIALKEMLIKINNNAIHALIAGFQEKLEVALQKFEDTESKALSRRRILLIGQVVLLVFQILLMAAGGIVQYYSGQSTASAYFSYASMGAGVMSPIIGILILRNEPYKMPDTK